MGKAPAFQFYVRDWLSDPELRMACASTRGIWADCLAYMWEARERGKLIIERDHIARFMACTEHEAEIFLTESQRYKFCNVTFCNNEVTIINRRMHREEIQRKNTRLRVQRHRSNASCNVDVTVPSSSSSSPSKITTAKVSAFSLPDFLQKQTWELFLAHRKQIKHPITEKAYLSFVEKFRKLHEKGWPPDRVVDVMIEKGWRWFQADWVPEPPPAKKVVDLTGQERRAMQKDREQNKDEYLDPRQVAEITKKLGLDFGKGRATT